MADESTQQGAGGNTYREEVERALKEDTTRLGDVWRRPEQDAEAIAEELGVPTSGFVYPCRVHIKAITDDPLTDNTFPKNLNAADRCASALRGFVKRHKRFLSLATRLELQERADECDSRAADPVKRREEEERLELRTTDAEENEENEVPGIYVYALPHYLRHPIKISENDETDDRTYLKVGMSENNVIQRFREQRRSTVLPESPVLLRIYVAPNGKGMREIEKQIHGHLCAADHVRQAERGAGTEWFLTHLKFLDSTATNFGLEIRFAIDDSDDD